MNPFTIAVLLVAPAVLGQEAPGPTFERGFFDGSVMDANGRRLFTGDRTWAYQSCPVGCITITLDRNDTASGPASVVTIHVARADVGTYTCGGDPGSSASQLQYRYLAEAPYHDGVPKGSCTIAITAFAHDRKGAILGTVDATLGRCTRVGGCLDDQWEYVCISGSFRALAVEPPASARAASKKK